MTSESEDLISEKVYSVWLRKQFERFYSVRGWAAGNSDKKRVRLDGAGAGGGDAEMDEVEGEGEGGGKEAARYASSLEEILRSTTNSTGKLPGKLRPGKLTVVRLSDRNRISGAWDISCSPPLDIKQLASYQSMISTLPTVTTPLSSPLAPTQPSGCTT